MYGSRPTGGERSAKAGVAEHFLWRQGLVPRQASPPRRGRPLDVLLLDASMKQVLAATRSLGKAGLRVGLAERCEARRGASAPPAFRSRWAASCSVLPDFAEDPDAYALGVLELVKAERPAVVMASSDQSIASLGPWRSLIEDHCRLALGSPEALALATDKLQTLKVASSVGVACPFTVVVGTEDDVRAAMDDVGYPAVVKPAVPWVRQRGGERLKARDVLDEAEASAAVAAVRQAGSAALVQPWSGGQREAVTLLSVGGRVVAEFAHMVHRTSPMLGGASVLRESMAMPPDLRWAAVSLVETMGLEGYAEVEFRRDRQGQALLMEVNPRLSGAMEVALRSGVDFPLMMWQWASGQPVDGPVSYRVGVRLRWLTGDLRWLAESLRRPGRADACSGLGALGAFLADFGRPTAYDFLDWHDLMPAAAETVRVARRLGAKTTAKLERRFAGSCR